jgi:hypothetical protein
MNKKIKAKQNLIKNIKKNSTKFNNFLKHINATYNLFYCFSGLIFITMMIMNFFFKQGTIGIFVKSHNLIET